MDDPRPPADATRRLLSGLERGDARLAARLVERLQPELLRHARKLVERSRRLAPSPEDLVQTTWSRALHRGRLLRFESRNPGALLAWLRRIQECALTDHLRSASTLKRGAESRHVSVDEALASGATDAAHPTPTSSARYDDLIAVCRDELGEREWRAWRLVELSGLTAPEAARELGVSSSAVRSLLHRARTKIIERLGKELP